jgi:hypothetical protein
MKSTNELTTEEALTRLQSGLEAKQRIMWQREGRRILRAEERGGQYYITVECPGYSFSREWPVGDFVIRYLAKKVLEGGEA